MPSLRLLYVEYNLLTTVTPGLDTTYSTFIYNCLERSSLSGSVSIWLDMNAPNRWEQRNVLCPVTVPSPPTNLTAFSGSNGQVPLSWTAPTSNGGTALTDYAIEYKKTTDSLWTTFSHAPSVTTAATVT